MPKTIPINILDHNFKQLKIWLQNCANNWDGGWEAKTTLYNFYRLVIFLEKASEKMDEIIVEEFAKFSKEK